MLQRDLLMQAVAPRGGRELLSGAYDPVTLEELSGAFSSAQLLANLQSIQQTLGAMASQPNPRIAAELCLIRLCRPELCDDVPTLCARMDKLEQTVYSGAIPAPRASAPAPKEMPEPKPVLDDVPHGSRPHRRSLRRRRSPNRSRYSTTFPYGSRPHRRSPRRRQNLSRNRYTTTFPLGAARTAGLCAEGEARAETGIRRCPPMGAAGDRSAPIPEPTPEPVPEPEPEPIPEPVSAPRAGGCTRRSGHI